MFKKSISEHYTEKAFKMLRALNHFKGQSLSLGKIELSNQEVSYFVYPDEIILCQSDNTYTYVYLISGERIFISKPLKRIQEELECYDLFFRTHQSYLVNVVHIRGMLKREGVRLLLSNKLEAGIAKRHLEQLRQRL